MDILLVSESKLKVMMTKEDMEDYALDADCADYDTTEMRHALWSILDEAKRRTGFEAARDKLLVQLYPSKDGGCELFVTKLGLVSALTEKTLARSGRVAMLSARRCVYRFERLCDLSAACLSVADMSAREGDVYYADDGCYYLFLEERMGKSDTITPLARLSEWGECVSPDRGDYIQEHGICIKQGGAVALFAKL